MPDRPIPELATLLARGYLRLLSARQGPEIAQDASLQHSPTGVRIGVDVAEATMAQLPREARR